jgi:DNA mismatch endonuclease, patch repair protein
MTDVVDAITRSRMMSGIRSKNTRPELIVRAFLHNAGFRYRLHVAKLPGKPDVVLRKYNAVIFVNGCFWHGHNCKIFKWPATRSDFWRSKVEGNRRRDELARERLVADGWRIATVWECKLRSAGSASVLEALADWLEGSCALFDSGAEH